MPHAGRHCTKDHVPKLSESSVAGAFVRLADDQLSGLELYLEKIISALKPLVPRIDELEERMDEVESKVTDLSEAIEGLESGKADKIGFINIEGEVDGVPAVISGAYEAWL